MATDIHEKAPTAASSKAKSERTQATRGGHKRRRRGWPPKVGGAARYARPSAGAQEEPGAHASPAGPQEETYSLLQALAGLGRPLPDCGEEARADDTEVPALAPRAPTESEARALIDPELISMLERLSVTIDTAHHILFAAAKAQAGHMAPRKPSANDATPAPERPSLRELIPETLINSPAPPRQAGDDAIGVIACADKASARRRIAPAGFAAASIVVMVSVVGLLTSDLAAPVASLLPAESEVGATSPRTLTTASVAPPTVSVAAAPAHPTEPARPSQEAVLLQGEAGRPLALGLQPPQHESQTEVSALIQGLPDGATLSAGHRVGLGSWILDASEMAEAALTVPPSLAGERIALDVTLVRSDGSIPVARHIVIDLQPEAEIAAASPASAPAPSAPEGTPEPAAEDAHAPPPPVSATLTEDEEQRLLVRSRDLIQRRDMAAARLVLEYAARRGSRRAMLALARTYDPEYLSDAYGVRPDASQAAAWYERAARVADR